MEVDNPNTLTCTLIAIDHTSFSYKICSLCEKTLPYNNSDSTSSSSSSQCRYCTYNDSSDSTSSVPKRLFRILMSIASETEVFVVVMFDRAARVLFGCSADDLFDFVQIHPFAAVTAGKILEGEMLRVTLSKSKCGNAEHQRVVSVVPLRSNFRSVIHNLRDFYGVTAST